jgi:hypothetical protein
MTNKLISNNVSSVAPLLGSYVIQIHLNGKRLFAVAE